MSKKRQYHLCSLGQRLNDDKVLAECGRTHVHTDTPASVYYRKFSYWIFNNELCEVHQLGIRNMGNVGTVNSMYVRKRNHKKTINKTRL